MKVASVRELRNHYTKVLRWVGAGEEVLITLRGNVIAKLVPQSNKSAEIVNWAESPEVKRDRRGDTILSARQSVAIRGEAGGKW